MASETELLGPRLYEGMAVAVAEAERRNQGYPRDRFPHLWPLHVRVALRIFFEDEGLPAGWRVGGNPALMGQLYLSNAGYGLDLRVLKERRRTYPGGVPLAGANRARRDAWSRPLRQDPIPGLEGGEPHQGGLADELLLLWDYRPPEEEGAFVLRVVHPVEPGQFPGRVRCDLDYGIRSGGTIFDRLEFIGDADDQRFFEADIDEASGNIADGGMDGDVAR